ncbi:RE1 [Symbiodinium sp. CCMP2592]|nr:RE1 [Symbiodinium sp. CCMP2592]
MSGIAEGSATTTSTRTKDGIPTWSGEASSFTAYEEAALLWEQSLTYDKRYTAGPKLVQELSGAARRYVTGQPAGWVAFRGGVVILMDHLRKALGKPRVNEVTDLLTTYFKGSKRRSGESMNEYITKKTEAYMRASQALRRVQPHYEKDQPGTTSSATTPTAWQWHGHDYGTSNWGRQWTPASEGDGTASAEETASSTRPSEAAGSQDDPWQGANAWNTGQGWNWYYGWQGWNPGGRDWRATSWSSTSQTSEGRWYLLMDAGLDHGERNLVMTALGGDFQPQRVGQELRNQFPEGEVRRRDQNRRHQSYIGELADEMDEDFEDLGVSPEDLEAEGMNEEGVALVVDAEAAAQSALAALHEAKRTLKDARFRQKMVKQNRKYYQSSGRGSWGHKPRDDSNMECLACGKKGHRAANCPNQKTAAIATATEATEHAPFVCYSGAVETETVINEDEEGFAGYADHGGDGPLNEALSAEGNSEGITTAEAVTRGYCVVDGGATQTIGSVVAVESVLRQNRLKYGDSRLKGVNTENPPSFAFGNSSTNRCLSTAKLMVSANGSPGELRVHTLNHGQSPILLSVETLRKVGAVIDFSADLAVFRQLDPTRIIPLTRGASGHQLLPLTEDWMQNALPATGATEVMKPLHARHNVLSRDLEIMLSLHHFPERMAAIPAQSQVFHPTVLQPLAIMERWNKPELTLFLRTHGEEPPRSWTKVQLKQRIYDMIEQGEAEAPASNKKSKTPLQMMTAEMNKKSQKKATLIKYAEEEHNVKVTPNDTISTIQRKLLNYFMSTVIPVGEDVMGFGKKYVEWAKTTSQEGDCSPFLRRFVRWVNEYADFEDELVTAMPTKPEPEKVKSPTPKKGYPNMENRPVPSTGEASSSSNATEQAVMQLANVVSALMKEVQDLKEEKSEKPRKITARPDELMEKTKDNRRDTLTAPVDVRFGAIQELKAKRAHANKLYESTIEIVKFCQQQGTHVTVELPEKCEAWRLPLFQKLRFEMGLQTCVTKGCSVGLRGGDGQMMMKGWRLVTSHGRLAEMMHKPCQCSAQYKHAKCEGTNAKGPQARNLATLEPLPPKLSTISADVGAFRSHAVEEWCDKYNIFLDVIPGEAHWKIGTCENAVKGVKAVMEKLSLHDEEITATEALSEAVAAFNHKELVRGFSPAQHLLGQAPDETGRFVAACKEVPPHILCEHPDGEFERAVQRRAEAEKAVLDYNAQQRILRAKHSRHRPCYDYVPGELVYYWRTQDAQKGRRQPGGKHGRFLGPARILATETRREPDGTLKPGGVIWVVKGRSLLKCSAEQLRRASHREELLESLADNPEQRTPWSFQSVAAEIGGNKFEDLTDQVPDLREWTRAQQPEEEVQPTRYRFRGKRAPHQRGGDEDVPMEEDETENPPVLHRERSRSRGPTGAAPADAAQAAWWNDVATKHWPQEESAYWSDDKAAVEIEIPMPESVRGQEKAWRNLGAYFVGSMKRRAVELSERRMTAQELEAFQGAKAIEVKNFVASKAFETLPEHLKPDRSQAIGMRWILTWKLKEDGSRKAKARAVLLGYQDGSYEHRATSSPVMTRQSRQLILQMAAWRKWQVQKGDVTGAFLQSRQYPDELFCIPTPEICRALNIPEGSVTRVKRACYGLVDAPLEWYRSVDSFLQEIGFERLWSDSCCWALREKGELRGIVSGHVDDFLFAGQTGDKLWESKLQAIREKFKWGDWETGKFTQCGVIVKQTEAGFELSQPTYLENLHEITVNASRRKDRSQATSDKEKTQLRALLGGISWHAQQVAPYLAADVGLLLTEVSRSTVDTIIRANILLSTAKAKQNYVMHIHAFDPREQVMFVGWVDAANGNRVDGGSTQGIFIGATTTGIMEGKISKVSPIGWHSQKIDRACRSPGAAEAQAAVNGEDSLYATRHQWSELLWGAPDLQRPDSGVCRVQGCLVTDSRNVYDKLETEVLVVKGAEKRTSIELLAIKESQIRTGLHVRWVHSEAQLANSLTKSGGHREYDLFVKMNQQWRLVEDASMMSARRRREQGLLPLEQPQGKSRVTGVQQDNVQPKQTEPEELLKISSGGRGA